MEFSFNTRRILSYTRRAVDDYEMIQDGDKIAVGLSGGKDSVALVCALANLKKFYPKKFEIEVISMDPGFYKAGFGNESEIKQGYEKLRDLCRQLEVNFTLFETDIAKIIFDVRKEKNPCSLCARMRRGALHTYAKSLGCNKIALGHHFDDAVETFMMNLFNEGRIGCFSPVTYLDRMDITVLRPLVYVPEKDIRYFINHSDLPVLQSPCPADKNSDRENIKQLLTQLDKENKGIKYRIFGAMQRAGVDGYKLVDDSALKEM
ncbi:MAG: tRNA 2-thiocytidine(32) synthetase TtcA [Clostridia bacterium]|nr:tRNA 2-thiocytidine(32) synthetase TtcA [Clostridia bacterium]